jgi:hypothetical protein
MNLNQSINGILRTFLKILPLSAIVMGAKHFVLNANGLRVVDATLIVRAGVKALKRDYHQKQSLKYAIKAGESILKIKELCLVEKKNFKDFLKECDISWNKSYVYFLISFYHFSKDYPKICNVSQYILL